jgi:hypothetical protein
MNGTFIRVDGTGAELRYNTGIRNRGGASRIGPPNNYRVNFPHDAPWRDQIAVNLNSRYVHSQIIGSAIYQLAGIPAATAIPVRVRVNGQDLAEPDAPRMFGSYAQLEVVNGDFPENHMPLDSSGNLYRAYAVGAESGDLRFEGSNPDAYRDTYRKLSNQDEDDWSDLIQLTNVLNEAPDATFVEQLAAIADIDQWLRYLALDALLGNMETGLSFGSGDNYLLYHGDQSQRFILLPYDLDTLLGRARVAQRNRSIFAYTDTPGLRRFLTHPDLVPRYYQAFLDLIRDVYNPATLNPLFEHVLGGFIPAEEIEELKEFVVARTAGVLAQIPREFRITSGLPMVSGFPRTTLPATGLVGTADAVRTKSVLVNGVPARWSPFEREWALQPVGVAQTELLIPQGAVWRFLDDGSEQDARWRRGGFDDAAWSFGRAPLGYGDGDEATRIDFGPNPANKFITSYFRHEFHVPQPERISGLTIRLLRDDGAIVYLNGAEVARSNMPAGAVDFQTVASSWVGGALEEQFESIHVDPRLLRAGANVVAVELHQNSAIDFDASFDLVLEATTGQFTGGVALRPGINRVHVEAFDAPGGGGNLVHRDFLDIWYDGVPAFRPGELDRRLNELARFGQLAPFAISGGVLSTDTVLAPIGAAYRVTGDIVVPAGVTLTILPGTSVFFAEHTGITVQGGRLVAAGEPFSEIRLTRVPGSPGTWDGIQLEDTLADNRIRHAIVEYAVSDDGMIGLENSRLVVESSTLDHSDRFRIRSENSSLVVRDSIFTDIFGPNEPPTTDNSSEHIGGSGILDGGVFLVENNYFGTTKGHNDAVDFDTAELPGPIPIIRNNYFAGGGDDGIDIEADALIEGNTFVNFLKDGFNVAIGDANSISAGGGRNYYVARNDFYNVDHAVQVKDDAFLYFENNTVVQSVVSAIYFELEDRSPGRGATVESSIFHDVTRAFDAIGPNTTLTVNRSIVPEGAVSLGQGNSSEDPRLRAPQAGDFSLRPGSPAIGAGQFGRDMGSHVPGGVWVSGIPTSSGASTSHTARVGGPAVATYQFRLNGSDWNGARSTDEPIELRGLTNGRNELAVRATNIAGELLDERYGLATFSWDIDNTAPRVVINEVLAINDSVAGREGRFSDLIELYNPSGKAVDLAGMSISDAEDRPDRYVFAAGTLLGAGEYLTLVADNDSSTGGIHLRFSLDGQGEGVFLFDKLSAGGALIDAVRFGPQVADRSIGRVGGEGQWTLTQPTFGAPNLPSRLGDVTRLRINEWVTSGQVQLDDDFIELYNGDPLPVELSGLTISDDPVARPDRHRLPPLSFVGGHGFVVLIADDRPNATDNHLGFQLANDFESIGLFDDALNRLDQVFYYSQSTDRSEGRFPDGADAIAFTALPTPGFANRAEQSRDVSLVPWNGTWAFDDSGTDRGTAWRDPAYDDSSWKQGSGIFAFETAVLPPSVNTDLAIGPTTYYFRTKFFVEDDPRNVVLSASALIDDGAVIYVNEHEIVRLGLGDGRVSFDTRANRGVGNAVTEGPFVIPAEWVVKGENVIAVEVHQISPRSDDVVFGLEMVGTRQLVDQELTNNLRLIDSLRISEVMYDPPGGSQYEFVEFHNAGDGAVDVGGVRITGGIEYVLPSLTLAGGQHLVLAKDPAAFRARYGTSVDILGPYQGRLENAGERLVLMLADWGDLAILRFDYDSSWIPAANGRGSSLEIDDVHGRAVDWTEGRNWHASAMTGGSPGRADFASPLAVGDANADGRLDAADLIRVLQAGKYRSSEPAVWYEGDWNGDLKFDELDIVAVLQSGNYGKGPR